MRKLLAYFREDPVPVIHADQAAVHTMHGTSFTAYASPGRGSRELCAWHFQIPAHTTGVRHHVSREEVLYVLSGTIQASVDGRAEQATAGDMILVPAGAQFGGTTRPTAGHRLGHHQRRYTRHPARRLVDHPAMDAVTPNRVATPISGLGRGSPTDDDNGRGRATFLLRRQIAE